MGGYPVDTANWAISSAWVKELPEDDQVIVLVLLALGLDNHVSKVLMPAVKDRAGAQWVLKTSGNGNAMLVGLATRTEALRDLLREKADAHLEIINGRVSAADFDQLNDGINRRIMAFADPVREEDIARVRAAYRGRLAETETALIAYAKLRSS